MNPGYLRHRLDIGQYTKETDQWGDPISETEIWKKVATVSASVQGLRGSQYFQAQQSVTRADHKIKIRFRQDIKPGMLVRHDGREHTIHAVLDEEGTRRWLTLICQEVEPA